MIDRRVVLCAWMVLSVSVDVRVATAAPLDPALTTGLDAYLERAFELSRLPGLAVAVVTPDGAAYVRVWGVRSLADGAPLDVDVPLAIGSLTKSMTALVLLQLQEEGVLSLDDPIANTCRGSRPPGQPGRPR